MAPHTIVEIPAERIVDRETFHDVFADVLGFPDFYGRNMDAWIDCLESLDEPGDGMTKVHAPPDGILVLAIRNAKDFAVRCPELYLDLLECSAFVNHARIDLGQGPVLALSFFE